MYCSAEVHPDYSDLGKKAHYDSHYNPDKLFAIPRKPKRDEIGIAGALPFFGMDIWNHYEVSWLNKKGKPITALAEIIYHCESPHIIESKSMKLYFNSFNNTSFQNVQEVVAIAQADIEARINSSVIVNIFPLSDFQQQIVLPKLAGLCIDDLDIDCSIYHACPDFLQTENEITEEILCSNLLKSNCLVTNQPDWCSVQIAYRGKKINHAGLLRYIISFRNDNEFHEQCIEKIFMHIMQRCQPQKLTVYGRSTRRGGLDINSYRSTEKKLPSTSILNTRLCRQ